VLGLAELAVLVYEIKVIAIAEELSFTAWTSYTFRVHVFMYRLENSSTCPIETLPGGI
jgi:hypothetical protein